MHTRWFDAAVVIFWLTTMSWLVTTKVLPSLVVGEPPSYSKIIEAHRSGPTVGWRLMLDDYSLGWALTETKPQPADMTEIHGRVHFDALPLATTMPSWLKTFAQLIDRPKGNLKMDARSLLVFDPLGHLARFDSTVQIDPFTNFLRVRGTVDGQEMELVVRTGGGSITTKTFLPFDAIVCDALSPQSHLPGLRAGQTWTVPVYSPLWPKETPLEIIHATVEELESISWNGSPVSVWRVVYRDDPGSGAGNRSKARGSLWVQTDGVVLKQQVVFFDSTITFLRMPDEEATALAKEAGPEWWTVENPYQSAAHD